MTFGIRADIDEDGELCCPRCGGNNLHQQDTTIFARGEDDDTTTVIAQNWRSVQATDFPSNDTCNPSPRRHGLTIEFTCESCHGDAATLSPFRLAILQHKGTTYVEWK